MASIKTILHRKSFARWFSDEGLTNKAKLNALASAVDYAARLLVGFVINPLLVSGLGDAGFGTWQVLGRMIGYISPASGRPSQALKWTIANRQDSDDFAEKRRLVGSAIAVWLLFVPLLAILGGILVYFVPIWLDTPADFYPAVRLATALLVANLIMISLADLPRSVLIGENLEYKRMGLSAALVLVGGGLTALALYSGAGLVGVAAATLAATLLTGLLFYRVMRNHVPWFGVSRPSTTMLRQFARLSGWFLVWNLVMQLMRGSDVVVLGAVDSVEQVTTYTLTKYVPENIITFVAILVFGISPGLGAIIGSEDHARAIRVRGEIMILTWLMVVTTGSAVLLWNPSFVRLWIGPGYDVGSLVTLLIVIMMAQFVIIRNDASLIDLTLVMRHKVILGFVSALLAAGLAVLFVGPLQAGIVGLCLGFILGRSLLSIGYPWLVGRHLGLPFHRQFGGALRPALVTALLFMVASYFGARLSATTWITLIIFVVATVVVAGSLALLVGVSHTQRSRLFRRVQIIARSRK